ncbi:lysosomal acid glucosylceramidase-like [Styela clava]
MKSVVGYSLILSSIVIAGVVSLLLVLLMPSSIPQQRRTCEPKYFDQDRMVCVCNSTYCDTLDPLPDSYPEGYIIIYTSSQSGLRFNETSNQFRSLSQSDVATITVNSGKRLQTIKGFGGAFTDAAGINIASLPQQAQENLLRSYFSPEGIEYNMGRIPIASCDFSTRGYTYNDFENDFALTNFSLASEDFVYKIPYIKKAVAMNKRKMSFYASPWTAPAWMKTNNDLIGKGSLKGEPGGPYYHTWALYFARFIEEYTKNGVDIWGLTAQNEPSAGNIQNFPFQCMGFSDIQQRDFIKLDLGPTLENRGHGDVTLMIMDDQRLLLPEWPKVVLNDSVVNDYVDGIAIHWYMDFMVPPQRLTETHELFPDKFMLASEACAGANPLANKGVVMGSWERGERYSDDIIEDITNYVSGWVDWNIALDMRGGPNWVRNFVDSPIIVNKESYEFYKQPMFYHMGHFSKFVPEGSVRIESLANQLPFNVKHVAFLNPNTNQISLVVLNKSENDIIITVRDSASGEVEDVLEKRSIKTYVWSLYV